MSIFNAPSFYSAPDRQTYAAGDFFIPQEKYTFGGMPRQVIPTGGITATTTANVLPRRILPFDQGGGDGGGITDITTEDLGTTADDFGFGLEGNDPSMNMTKEEKDAINAYNNPATTKGMLGTIAGTMFGFLDPFTAMASLAYQRNKAKKEAMERATEAAQQADFDRAMAQGQGFYDSLNEGRGASVSQESREQAAAGYDSVEQGSPFADGGRVPYMMGGLTNLVDIYD